MTTIVARRRRRTTTDVVPSEHVRGRVYRRVRVRVGRGGGGGRGVIARRRAGRHCGRVRTRALGR